MTEQVDFEGDAIVNAANQGDLAFPKRWTHALPQQNPLLIIQVALVEVASMGQLLEQEGLL